MSTTFYRKYAVRPAHRVPTVHGLAIVLLLGACGSDDEPAPGGGTGLPTPVVTGDAGVGAGPGGATAGGTTAGGTTAGGTFGAGTTPGGTTAGGTFGAGTTPGGTTAGGTFGAGTGDAGAGSGSDSGTRSDGGTTTSDGGGGSSGGTKSAGCGKAPPTDTKSIMVGGKTGAYLLDVPTNYDNNKAYPLVFVWHGSGVKNGMFRDYVGISKAAGNDAIVVTPECLDGVNAWPSDASYFDALLERFSANYCVDTSKVFTAGHSMGGQHTGLLGCLRGDKLRGDAVLAMTHPTGTCVGTKMAAMFVVGDSDFANYATETKYWTDKNKCNMAMTTPVADATQCVEYGGCAPDAQVRTCTFPGGHEIPNWVGAAVWGFFKKL